MNALDAYTEACRKLGPNATMEDVFGALFDQVERFVLVSHDLERVTAERDAARAVLRDLEWQWANLSGWCPVCQGSRDYGHQSDCSLAAALASDAPPAAEPTGYRPEY